MHADEVPIDAALVRRLLAGQFPQWAGRPIEPVRSFGTDNAMYRLGDDLVVRLPRRERTARALARERRWLPELAPLLPVAAPVPLADGMSAEGYPFEWCVYPWLHGEEASAERIGEPEGFADDLAALIAGLRRVDPGGGPEPGEDNVGRGEPLANRDAATRVAIQTLGAHTATAVWDAALRSPPWDQEPVWIHGDLDARNLLVEKGRLSAVIDWGCVGVGDPAYDVMAAWKVLPPSTHHGFRAALGVDEATWVRARGLVVSQALIALAYYTEKTNPVLVREARRWLGASLGG
jgi:aminoglycoside phosphotransferase (APT) family kinase protein